MTPVPTDELVVLALIDRYVLGGVEVRLRLIAKHSLKEEQDDIFQQAKNKRPYKIIQYPLSISEPLSTSKRTLRTSR